MGRKNPMDKVLDRVVEDFKARLKKAKKAAAVPFGQEELRPRDARARWERMTPLQKQKHLQEVGQEEILRMLRGRNATSGT